MLPGVAGGLCLLLAFFALQILPVNYAGLLLILFGLSLLMLGLSALGGHLFNRTPVSLDMIINFLSKRPQAHKPLQINTV